MWKIKPAADVQAKDVVMFPVEMKPRGLEGRLVEMSFDSGAMMAVLDVQQDGELLRFDCVCLNEWSTLVKEKEGIDINEAAEEARATAFVSQESPVAVQYGDITDQTIDALYVAGG